MEATAVPEEGRKRSLVDSDQKDQQKTHAASVAFPHFLSVFVPEYARKATQMCRASWLLETTGAADASELRAELDAEVRRMFSSPEMARILETWDKDPSLKDPILKRQLNGLIRTFKQNLIAPERLEELARKEAQLSCAYAGFRAQCEGRSWSENEIREVLRQEDNVARRKEIWNASKQVGVQLAPQILELVALRNQAARDLGYSDYFQMQLELQEVDGAWLESFFDKLATDSEPAYLKALEEIETRQMSRFKELGPWAWSEPFCQEDPLDAKEFDQLVASTEYVPTVRAFYQRMGFDVQPILDRSDLYERPNKSQHAFCMNIDRGNDVRTLNNLRPTLKWLETLLHELGHAVYELGFDPSLPWLLRSPPHMITTEAMALIAGRQAYREESLKLLLQGSYDHKLLPKVEHSHCRRQLIFSRWVFVMTNFERELYRDPSQDLNKLWWHCVSRYQKIAPPPRPAGAADWAAKYHIGLAPVYYFSYLLGELFASSLQKAIPGPFASPEMGRFLQQKVFAPGDRLPWFELIQHATGAPITSKDWLGEFAR